MNVYLFVAVVLALGILAVVYFIFFGTKANIVEKSLALAAMGNFIDAKATLREQIDLEPNDPKLLYTFSKIYGMENDLLNEVNYLEKVKSIGKYEKEFPPIVVNNRIANIYYQQDMFDEAFFYYLDSLNYDPVNLEALIRLAFMAVGQKDFDIADKFMRQIPDEEVKIQSYFIAKGVVTAMLNRDNDFEYFEKAFRMDTNSPVAGFLYALSLSKIRKFKEAYDTVSPMLDMASDDLIRFTISQFIMTLNSSMSDYVSALTNAKTCIDLAKKNGWHLEAAECNAYYAMLCIVLNNLEEASEYLIEAEAERVDDYDIMSLAQYKADLEDGTATPGKTSARGYNLKNTLKDLPERLFPKERYFEISGLKSSETLNIRGIINQDGQKIISKLNQLSPDKISKLNTMKGNIFKNTCIKILAEYGYKVKRELPALEAEGANFVCIKKGEEDERAVFRIRKWKNMTISDVFLTELLNSMSEQEANKGYVIGSAELTPGAKKVIKANDGKLVIVNGKELESLLEKVIK
jgi:tetratricopeptide (TPR) repeat protein